MFKHEIKRFNQSKTFNKRHGLKRKNKISSFIRQKNHSKYEKENIDMEWRGFWDSYFYYRKSPLNEFGYLDK